MPYKNKAFNGQVAPPPTEQLLLANGLDSDSIHCMGSAELLVMQQALNQGTRWGTWITPISHAPEASNAVRNVNIRDKIENYLPASVRSAVLPAMQDRLKNMVDASVLSCVRYLVICSCVPTSLLSKRQLLDCTTVARIAYDTLPKLAAAGISKAFSAAAKGETEDFEFSGPFAQLSEADAAALSCSPKVSKLFITELRRMQLLASQGLWDDAPTHYDVSAATRLSGVRRDVSPPIARDPHIPLPDQYTADMGMRSHWLAVNLFPNVERALAGFKAIWQQAALDGVAAQTLRIRCARFLDSFKWIDTEGNEIIRLPFDLRLAGKELTDLLSDEEGEPESQTIDFAQAWPPSGVRHVIGLARTVQAAHYFIVSLSTGARKGELNSLPRHCIRREKDGTLLADGKTYKLVIKFEGEDRSWILPALAIQAIRQQALLADLLEKLSDSSDIRDPDSIPDGPHLWLQVGGTRTDRTKALRNCGVNELLLSFARSLGMSEKPGGQKLRPHRMRKTLARIAALAISQAPKVLQDCFGHQSVEMTLYYILTDKSLQVEIQNVLDELRVMRAEEAVSEMVAAMESDSESSTPAGDGYGGLAAISVRNVVGKRLEDRKHEGHEWTHHTTRETAELLTLQGKTWTIAAPGVICTKEPSQAGPCTGKRGHPNGSRCGTGCDHRLEDPAFRRQVDDRIAYALQCYEADMAEGSELSAEGWAGQVRANIGRFPDLHQKWQLHPAVIRLIT